MTESLLNPFILIVFGWGIFTFFLVFFNREKRSKKELEKWLEEKNKEKESNPFSNSFNV